MEQDRQIYYYHSKPCIDPKNRGRRITVCCIRANNRLVFGIAVIHKLDNFSKSKGRRIALGRAEQAPIKVLPTPNSQVKAYIVDMSKQLVKEHLRPLLDINWDKQNQKMLKNVERDEEVLKVLLRYEDRQTLKTKIENKLKTLAQTKKAILSWMNLKEEEPTAIQLNPA